MRFVRRLGDAPGELDVEGLADCLSEYPLSLAVLFGSVARDQVTDLSDLEVAVVFGETVSSRSRSSGRRHSPSASRRASTVDADTVLTRLGKLESYPS